MALCHSNWDILLDITKRRSGDPTCTYQRNFHAGEHQIVRLIKLARRGELWLARIPNTWSVHLGVYIDREDSKDLEWMVEATKQGLACIPRGNEGPQFYKASTLPPRVS